MPNSKLIIFVAVAVLGAWVSKASHAGSVVATECQAAPVLAVSTTKTVTVGTVEELHRAVSTLEDNTTLLIRPGAYWLKSTLSVTANNVTIRGVSDRCDSVHLIGAGMDNPDHGGVRFGFWINAENTTIANMTISDVYYHAIQINGNSRAPRIYNVRMLDIGQQFVKSNPNDRGSGVDLGVVEYSVMEYTNGTPKTDHDNSGIGYTNGVDVHAGNGWQIKNNVFKNFHTPDSADHLWNAAVLVWRGSSDTVTESNFFYNVDRAVAYGLGESANDHRGGLIGNNLVLMSDGLYSRKRRRTADAPLIVWHSPGTKVLHNTIITNGNMPFAIESRFDKTGVVLANNLTDAPIVHSEGDIKRNLCKYARMCKAFLSQYANQNVMNAKPNWFIDLYRGRAQLKPRVEVGGLFMPRFSELSVDFVGTLRGKSVTPGAFEISGVAVAAE